MARPWQKRRGVKRTTLLALFLGACLLGLGLGKSGYRVDESWILLALVVTFTSLTLNRLVLVGVVFLGLTLGWWRGGTFAEKSAVYQRLYKQNITLTGRAVTDASYNERSQLSFDVDEVTIEEPVRQRIAGKLAISGFGEAAVYRGDMVRVEGKIFPSRGSRQGSMSFAEFRVIGRNQSPVESLRLKFSAGMQSALPEPLASFGLGLLVGQRSTLPDDTAEMLSMVGLTHIIAVSGYNLTIIMRSVRRLLGGRSKYQTAVFSALLIAVFLLFTGFSPSIVRAAIVSLLSLAAWYYGRRIKPLVILLLAAVLTAWWNPFYIWSDIGWYLSFLAFFGVLIVAPLIIKRCCSKKVPGNYLIIFIESLAAQIMTMPLILFIFSEVSLIALVANLLIVPFVPLAMALSLAAGIGGMLAAGFAGWIAWPARFLLTYMLDMAAVLSRVPYAFHRLSLSLRLMLGLYASLVAFTLLLWHKTRGRRDIITDNDQLI